MRILVARFRLRDYLTFSSSVSVSSVSGVSYTVYRPQPYLHNYPLMYAIYGLDFASLASKVGEFPEINYSALDEIEGRLYVYPARPRLVNVRRLVGNVKGEGFVEPVQKPPKSMYPWHVVHVAFAPGSEFETVVVLNDESFEPPHTIRLGVKRQGVFDVEYTEAKVKGTTSGTSDPINLGDIERAGLAPDSFTLLMSTKTVRKGVPDSNIIARGFYSANKLVIVLAKLGIEEVTFRLPLVGKATYVGQGAHNV